MGLVVAVLAVCGWAALVRLFLRWGRCGRGFAVSLVCWLRRGYGSVVWVVWVVGSGCDGTYPLRLVVLVFAGCSCCGWLSEVRFPYRFDELYPFRAVDMYSRGGLMWRGTWARSYALLFCELLLALCRGGAGSVCVGVALGSRCRCPSLVRSWRIGLSGIGW